MLEFTADLSIQNDFLSVCLNHMESRSPYPSRYWLVVWSRCVSGRISMSLGNGTVDPFSCTPLHPGVFFRSDSSKDSSRLNAFHFMFFFESFCRDSYEDSFGNSSKNFPWVILRSSLKDWFWNYSTDFLKKNSRNPSWCFFTGFSL